MSSIALLAVVNIGLLVLDLAVPTIGVHLFAVILIGVALFDIVTAAFSVDAPATGAAAAR